MASSDHDASKDSAKNQSSASGQEEAGPTEEESTPEMEQVTQKKGKKRRREEKEGKEGKKKKAAPTASPSERPLRERKSVVRYTATASRSIPATKALKIQQGPGEMLKDIPNVFFKLSKRKSDESLRVLHKILFGRKANVHFLKRNILQFSGFVWSKNEEKERSKVKEKLNKCNKDRLLDFCDLLDVYTLKVTTKKEEISAKLLEFLESPHATREVILSEKDTKGKKRRRGVKGTEEKPVEEVSSDKENTRPKKDKEAKKARKKSADGHKVDQHKSDDSIDINDESEDKRDDAEETTEHSNSEAEDEDNEHEVPESTKTLSDGEDMDEHEEPKSKVKSPAVRKVFRTKSKKGSSSSATQKADPEDETKVSSETKTSKGSKGSSKTEKKKSTSKKDSKVNSTRKAPQRKVETDSGSRVSHRSKKVKEEGKSNVGTASKDKKQIVKTASKDSKESKKQNVKTVSKDVKENKKQIKAKSRNGAKKKGKREDVFDEPSTEQLHAVVSEILKEVDFNVATLADIIRQLGAHFNTDLMHRKTEIKGILEEVINNMTDDEEEEEDGPEE